MLNDVVSYLLQGEFSKLPQGSIDIGLLGGLIGVIVGAIIGIVKWLDARSSGMIKEAKADLQLQLTEQQHEIDQLRSRIIHLEQNGRECRKKIREAQRFAMDNDYDSALIVILDDAEAMLP